MSFNDSNLSVCIYIIYKIVRIAIHIVLAHKFRDNIVL